MDASPAPTAAAAAHTLPRVSATEAAGVTGVARIGAVALAVTACLALFLRGLDALPSLVTGEPRGVTRFRTPEEAAHRLGVSLLVPTRLPHLAAWPPARVRAVLGRAATVEIRADGRDGRPARFVVFQAVRQGGELSRVLVPEGEPFHEVPATVAGRPALLRSVRVAGEGEYHELLLDARGRRVLLRLDGPADELIASAASLSEARP